MYFYSRFLIRNLSKSFYMAWILLLIKRRLQTLVLNLWTRITLVIKVALSQKVQDSFFIANFAIINIPFYYLKLLHPLHSIDKMSIFKTFTFTCLIYLQVQEVGFMSSTNNFIS